jgi:protein-tyrosine phosphatase
MKKVLFVCLGNICRSPLAEGVFQELVCENKLEDTFLVDSAGTAGYHIGKNPDARSIKTAANHGITLQHQARQLSVHDFDNFDYILAMDDNNYEDIKRLQARSQGKAEVIMFRDFDPLGKGNVPDPYHGTMADFEEVYEMCTRTSDHLLSYIQTGGNKK